jgi:GIY-YIG catalytic domain
MHDLDRTFERTHREAATFEFTGESEFTGEYGETQEIFHEAELDELEPEAEEGEVSRHGMSTQVSSWRAVIVDQYPMTRVQRKGTAIAANHIPLGGGVYIVSSLRSKPFYVGQTDDFQRRWRNRLLDMYQLGVIGTGRITVSPFPLLVWFGIMPSPTKSARTIVEWSLIRVLEGRPRVGARGSIALPHVSLKNDTSFWPFKVIGQDLTIANLLPKPYIRHAGTASDPYYRNNTLNVPLNTTFELTGEAAGLELFT